NVMTDEVMLTAAQNTQQGVLITVVIATLAGVALAVVIARGIVKPLVKGVNFSREIARGDLRAKLDVEQRDEIGQLAEAMREMQRALQYKAGIIKKFSEGDFSVDFEKVSEADELGESLVNMQESLNDVLTQVRVAVEQVAAGASQVSSASQDLSQGATESASSLEEISSSVNEINGQSRQNTDNAAEASQLSRQAATDAEGGQGQMHELRAAMDSISSASEEIKKVVKVIDDIAFQINLLALNANVEAARAGKYGKGFAVVAEEVRNLAVRSAEAVKETTAMVEQSVTSIETGNQLTSRTGEQLDSIVSGAQRVAQFLEEIAAASKEQSLAIDQITEGLGQVDQVTQANTASAEESASASEELSSQAQQLRASVERFKLKRAAGMQLMAGPAPRTSPGPESGRVAIPATVAATNGSNGSNGDRRHARSQPVVELDDDEFDRF
ncbi:MAG: methyl-accepting chemotaxis protein, partial [Spirochaetota bacterium]